MPQVHLVTHNGDDHLEFWCRLYDPYKLYYPKETYNKGEKPCIHCCMMRDGIIYRAPFSCERTRSPMYISGVCDYRGDRFFNASYSVSPSAAKRFSDLFGWLYGDKIKTKRKPKEKTAKKNEKRNDSHGSDGGTASGFLQDNSEPEKVRTVATPSESQTVECECTGEHRNNGRLQKLSELPVRIFPFNVLETVYDPQVQPVRSESEIPVDRERSMVALPGMREVQTKQGVAKIMNEEYDASYELTTAHACITCKCGTKVWYGCGIKQKTRPKYCSICEKTETKRIVSTYKEKVDRYELQRILDFELRREITK